MVDHESGRKSSMPPSIVFMLSAGLAPPPLGRMLTPIRTSAPLLRIEPPDECCIDPDTPPPNADFDCCERECFGDEDGCDAWYYGEDPNEEKVIVGAADPGHVNDLREAGKAVTADRAAKHAATENVQQRIQRMLEKLREK